MAEYVNVGQDKGILQDSEIMRSHGWGWILYRREEGLLLQVLTGGRAFIEKRFYLSPEEVRSFYKSGRDYLDQLYSRICRKTADYANRFENKVE